MHRFFHYGSFFAATSISLEIITTQSKYCIFFSFVLFVHTHTPSIHGDGINFYIVFFCSSVYVYRSLSLVCLTHLRSLLEHRALLSFCCCCCYSFLVLYTQISELLFIRRLWVFFLASRKQAKGSMICKTIHTRYTQGTQRWYWLHSFAVYCCKW